MSNEITKTEKSTAVVVKEYLDKNRGAIMKSLPAGFNYDRMCRTAINAISTTPAIRSCTSSSLFLSIVKAFSLGLEPNGALSEGYIVPYGNNATFMPSYRGMISLARRSGEIANIYASEVCKNDEFSFELGTDKKIFHRPNIFGDRGEIIAFYAVVKYKDGFSDFEIMSMAEIEKVRRSSKCSNSGPWKDWFEEMAKKTVIKRLLKRVPMSIELATAVNIDNKAEAAEVNNDVIDIEGLDVPQEVSKFEQKQEPKENKDLLGDGSK